MQNLFSFRFSENIWRVMPDADPGSALWVIELRDPDRREVSFAVIDLDSLVLKWHRQVEGTDWWTSLTAFMHNRIYLHNYRYPEVPEPTDLIAVDETAGLLSWILPNYILIKSVDQNLLEVATKQGDHFKHMYCNASTGQVMPFDTSLRENADEVILKEPVRYREGNMYFERLAQFIGDVTGGHIPVAIDYLEKRPYIIFSYYIYEQDKTVQYLLIVTDQKRHVLHEKLSEQREGTGRSTMMLKASTLVYLKNSNEFSSLTLS
ncbi:DUF4905 domain-containing protein [Dyadobacter sp. CY261]|uniref:DUF4905 domain-containing protein n=1 Tax=Dyadobacter sp. CY261 TaxID=2907203 RepID=UPI001F2DB8BE|nr:DUF4905 domain-containing protein [Dyadobacter sp. CY261]MCF0073155.1 DUF4905 domain-containing protein [Dyadobacter sp. CY261]